VSRSGEHLPSVSSSSSNRTFIKDSLEEFAVSGSSSAFSILKPGIEDEVSRIYPDRSIVKGLVKFFVSSKS